MYGTTLAPHLQSLQLAAGRLLINRSYPDNNLNCRRHSTIEGLSNYDDDHNDDFKKTIGYISLTSTARLLREIS